MSKYWSDLVSQLQPYVPGEQPDIANVTKLNTNENPYGPSPKVIAAMACIPPTLKILVTPQRLAV